MLPCIVGEKEVKLVHFPLSVVDMPFFGNSMSEVQSSDGLYSPLFEFFNHFSFDLVAAAVLVHPHSNLSSHSTILLKD